MDPRQKSSPWSKFLLSFGFIFVSGAYALWQNLGGGRSTVTQTPEPTLSESYKAANDALLQTLIQINTVVPTTTAPTSGQPRGNGTPAMPPPMMNKPMMGSGLYVNGSYTGDPFDAYYGTVQVKVIVMGGKIADVQFLQYPNSRSNSRMINSEAMPLLTQEAIQAQSAQVSGVSGATFTSDAFQQSLASALVLAKN
jgi:uncharacterized protein with FMN-binding domain